MAWYWWLLSPLLAFIIVLLTCDLIAFLRTRKYVHQGFKRHYTTILGQIALFLPNKLAPHDGMYNFKKIISEADDSPGLVVNDTRGGTALIYLTDLDLIRDFFLVETKVCKRVEVEDLKFYFSFFYENTEHALNQRMVFSEMFKIDNIQANIPVIQAVFRKHFGAISQQLTQEPKEVDFIDLNQKILKELADKILFGCQDEVPFVDDEKKTHITDFVFETIKMLSSFKVIMNPINLMLWGYPNKWNLLPGSKKASNNAKLVHKAIEKYYRQRIDDSQYKLGTNILDLMIKHNMTESQHKFSMKDIVGDLVLFLFAGSDSTSKTLSTVLYLLAKHPEWREKIREEIKAKDLNKTGVNFNDLDTSEALSSFVDECLRLHSAAPASFDKLVLEDFTLTKNGKKYKFSAKDKIVIPLCYLAASKRFFPEGEEFNPEHFYAANSKKIPQMSFIPFSAGRRACIGRYLAETIVKVGVVTALTMFDIHVPQTDINGWVLRVGLDMEHGKIMCRPLEDLKKTEELAK